MSVETDRLKQIFDACEVDLVFDVGANQGQYVERLRREVGYQGPVVSFEPAPDLVRGIAAKAERDANWYVRNIALSDFSGVATFNQMANSQFSSLHVPSEKQTSQFANMNKVVKSFDVPVTRLDDLWSDLQSSIQFSRPFLKMDTQGNDLSVVRGVLSNLSKLVGFQSELSVTEIYKNTVNYRDALSFYEGLGFFVSSMFLPNRGHFPRLIDIDVIMLNPLFFKECNL